MLFCTFLCRHCMTSRWKCLISLFVEGENTKGLSFSFPELRYGKKLLTFHELTEMEQARWSQREFTFYIERFHMSSRQPNWCYKTTERAAMLVYQDNPVGVDLFSYVKTFFCFNELAYMLATWVKTLYKWRFCSRRRCFCLTVTWSKITSRRKWIMTSIGQSKHMRVTHFNPLWVSVATSTRQKKH